MPPVAYNPRDVFLGAADLIERYGWVQHVTGNQDIGYCADGAIAVMFGFPSEFDPNGYWQLHYIASPHFAWRSDVRALTWTMFNDTPGMTKEKVLSMLRWLADVVKEEES